MYKSCGKTARSSVERSGAFSCKRHSVWSTVLQAPTRLERFPARAGRAAAPPRPPRMAPPALRARGAICR
eukprot:6950396-Alexandrium_andersonii.AAC.1